jgi:hypothetical protein
LLLLRHRPLLLPRLTLLLLLLPRLTLPLLLPLPRLTLLLLRPLPRLTLPPLRLLPRLLKKRSNLLFSNEKRGFGPVFLFQYMFHRRLACRT